MPLPLQHSFSPDDNPMKGMLPHFTDEIDLRWGEAEIYLNTMKIMPVWLKFPHLSLPFVLHGKSLSRARLCATPWTAARQAPPSMGFSRQGYWSGVPCPSPGDLPNPGIEPLSPAAAGGFYTTHATWEAARNMGCRLPFQVSVFISFGINTQKWNYWIVWQFCF